MLFCIVLLALANSSCIITERPDYSGEGVNYAPSIQSIATSEFPLGQLIIIPEPELGESPRETFTFEVDIIDENISQELEAEIIINAGPNEKPVTYFDRQVARNGRKDRPFTFTILRQYLSRKCNRIELNVSSDFQPESQRIPVDEFDIASVVWYLGFESQIDPPEFGDCQ